VDYAGLEPMLSKQNDTTYIVNFWATWCAPCIKELPYFQQVHDSYKDKKVKVLLVSLDFERQIQSRLLPFIEKNKITPEVVVLNDPASNVWIDKVDPSWSGAIPATLFIKNDKRLFFEKEFTLEEIEKVINQLN
jgi:thiol-disulfide isomerase/thioredoxin